VHFPDPTPRTTGSVESPTGTISAREFAVLARDLDAEVSEFLERGGRGNVTKASDESSCNANVAAVASRGMNYAPFLAAFAHFNRVDRW